MSKITKKAVNALAAEYANRVLMYGEHDQGAIRAFVAWKDAEAEWERQNPGKVLYEK